MSADEDDGPGTREVAHRLFAAEFEDADFSYAESDEERAPNYVVTPTGARVNRLFAVGVLTEVEPVGEDVLRGRVVDPTGAFVVYAGQYQPDAQTFLERAEPPAFVAVTGKARTFQPDDSDVVYTSIRPESINEVDAETRDRWVVGTAERTLDRVGVAAGAVESGLSGEALADRLRDAGVEESLAAGLPLALDHYGTTGAYLTAVRDLALDAARVVAGEREEVDALSMSPGDGGDGDLASLSSVDLDAPAAEAGADATTATDSSATADSRAGTAADDSDASQSADDASVTADSESASATAADSESASAADSGTTATETASEAEAESETEAATTDPEPDTEPAEATDETAPTAPAEASSEAPTSETGTGTVDSATADAAEEVVGADPVAAEPDDLGDPDAGDDLGDSDAEDDLGDFEPGEFDLDEEVREEVESEYGTEFQSGTEVEDAGEADIETPDPEELAESEAAADTDAGSAGDPDTAVDSADAEAAASEGGTPAESDDAAGAEPDEDVDLEDAVMDAMGALDDGDGAAREAVIDRVVERTGADDEAVADAIQSALMDGRCYEPDDATLKPI